MDIQKIKNFVYSYSSVEQAPDSTKLRKAALALICIAGLFSIFGFASGGAALVISVTLIIVATAYTITFLIYLARTPKPSFLQWFLMSGIATAYFAIVFLIIAMLSITVAYKNIILSMLLIAGWLIICMLILRIILVLINRGKFTGERKMSRSNSSIGAAIGVFVLGPLLGLAVRKYALSQQIILAIMCMLCIIVTCLASFAAIVNFLKYYYVWKYSLPERESPKDFDKLP